MSGDDAIRVEELLESEHLCTPVSLDAALAAARVAGNIGDVLGGLDAVSVNAGRLSGRVEVLMWCQAELQVLLDRWKLTDRFADTRALEEFMNRVKDSLTLVQDGSGAWAGLARSLVGEVRMGPDGPEPVPTDTVGT